MKSKYSPNRAQGFTLLEVLVALAILGIGLTLIMLLFAGSLRSVEVSEKYTKAVLYAGIKMEESIYNKDTIESTQAGAIEGTEYTWETEISPLILDEGMEDRYSEIEAYVLTVRVAWPALTGRKSVELNTNKTIPPQTDQLPEG